jgi:DNA-directed RNA polymerase specialized sigma24 family protein
VSANWRESKPWWESQLPELRSEFVTYLRHHVPGRLADHDDLANDTLLSISRELRGNSSAFPSSWFRSSIPKIEDERIRFRRLAMLILRRRIADLFRANVRDWSQRESIEDFGNIPNLDTDPERRMLSRQMLKITLQFLSQLPATDRDIVANLSGMQGGRTDVLGTRARQRLKRLRRRLAKELQKKLGATVAELLREEL